MRLKKVYISDYKNLKGFELDFNGDSSLDVFVGKNGTGKSNLFEALIEIFRHLDEFDSNGEMIDFDYRITYEIDEKITSIEWENGKLKINNTRNRKTVGKTPLPDNILVYYSGHNDTVRDLIGKYQAAFRGRIKGADLSDNRYFIGIGPEYKQLLLVASLLKPADSPCRRFVCEKLGIVEIGNELRIVLKRPYYARRKTEFEIENNDEADRFWKAAGVTREFLNTLLEMPAPDPDDERVRTEGYLSRSDRYILYIDVPKLLEFFEGSESHEVFDRLDNLHVLDMLEDISIPLKLTTGHDANTSFFSDGQFQSVYIFAVTELFKERHCLTLLDEPDSFLHPEWQHEFLSQIFEISDTAAQTNHTLLSSHSASTISSSEDDLISLFEIDGNSIQVRKTPKGEVISSLSAGLITFSEREARLQIQRVLSDTNGPILFTEGVSDEVILDTAWKKLYPGETMPFEIQSAFCCGFLGSLLQRGDLHDKHPQRKFFGLFDFDDAYNEWNGCNGDVLESDPEKCLARKLKNKETYALLLPVPSAGAIRDQVINQANGEHFKSNSRLSMELMFHGIPALTDYYEIDPTRPGNVIRFLGDKVRFAKTVVPSLDAAHFDVFLPIFDFVKSICVPQQTAT
ncbi:MAG: hypothetical protein CMO55_10170 [Verrucomicrobiales bacterium]|nr:hypothetical protein [Verrucomicrobiales bacterium]